MKINDKLIPNKYNKILYANDFKCKNLYNNMPLTRGLWSSSGNIATSYSGWYVVVPIEGGKTYTTSKKNIGAIYMATTATYPANGVSIIDAWSGSDSGNSRTIVTSSNAKYLFIGLLGGSSPTEQEKAQSIEELQVEIGSEATTFTPYKNFEVPEPDPAINIKNAVNSSSGTGIRINFTSGNQQFFIYGKCYHNSSDKLIEYHVGLQNGGLSGGLVKYKDLGGNIGVTPTINNTNKTVDILIGSWVVVQIMSTNDFTVSAI